MTGGWKKRYISAASLYDVSVWNWYNVWLFRTKIPHFTKVREHVSSDKQIDRQTRIVVLALILRLHKTRMLSATPRTDSTSGTKTFFHPQSHCHGGTIDIREHMSCALPLNSQQIVQVFLCAGRTRCNDLCATIIRWFVSKWATKDFWKKGQVSQNKMTIHFL